MGTVEVALTAEGDGDSELESGGLLLLRVRARNDRGEPDEPEWNDVTLELDGEPLVATALPATYGGLLLEPSPDAGCAAELTLRTGDASDVTICLEGWRALDLRCASPAVLAPRERVRVDAQLDVGALVSILDESPPEEGERIDHESNAELHDDLVAAWPNAWTASCGPDDEAPDPEP